MPAKSNRRVSIRPGYLIGISVSIEGGRRYEVSTLDPESRDASGAAVSRWETTKIVADPVEFDAATDLVAEIRNGLSAPCYRIGSFQFCDDASIEAFHGTWEACESRIEKWNKVSRTCRVRLTVFEGRITSDDVRNVETIRREISGMLAEVQAGIRDADPEAIRKAANKARDAGRVLTPEASQKVTEALNAARKVARDMTRMIKESGEGAADTLRTIKIAALRDARAAFLDLDNPSEIDALDAPPRMLDLSPVAVRLEETEAAPRPVDDRTPDADSLKRIGGIVDSIVPARSFDLDL